MKHLNIKTVGCFDTLLNNRLLLKGITFAKMYGIIKVVEGLPNLLRVFREGFA